MTARPTLTFTYTPSRPYTTAATMGSVQSTSTLSLLFSAPPMQQTTLLAEHGMNLLDLAYQSVIPMEHDRCQRTIEPPEMWDPRFEYAEFIAPIMTQGSCGSCWAFAATGCIASRFAFFMNQKVKPLSPTYLVMCATPEFSTIAAPEYGCYGGSLAQAFWFFSVNGVVAQDCLDVSLKEWVPGDTSIQRRVVAQHPSQLGGTTTKTTTTANAPPTAGSNNAAFRFGGVARETFVSCPLNKCINNENPQEIPFLYKLTVAYIVGGSPGQRSTTDRNIRL